MINKRLFKQLTWHRLGTVLAKLILSSYECYPSKLKSMPHITSNCGVIALPGSIVVASVVVVSGMTVN